MLARGARTVRRLLRRNEGIWADPDLRPLLAPLRARPGIELRLGGADLAPEEVVWERGAAGEIFSLSPALSRHPGSPVVAERLAIFSSASHHLAVGLTGATHVALGDVGTGRGLSFCDFRADALLIPDPAFLGSLGYSETRALAARSMPTEDRKPRALWRGTASGWHDVEGCEIVRQTDLPRVRLCEIGAGFTASALIDAKFSAPGPQAGPDLVHHLHRRGLLGVPVAASDFPRWRYQIDIDGNSNAWEGLFIKLLSGSVVLKVASAFGFRQWYYDRLMPWRHFVPVSRDMSDLVEKVEWCRRNWAAEIAMTRALAELTEPMTLPRELARTGAVVAEAFRRGA